MENFKTRDEELDDIIINQTNESGEGSERFEKALSDLEKIMKCLREESFDVVRCNIREEMRCLGNMGFVILKNHHITIKAHYYEHDDLKLSIELDNEKKDPLRTGENMEKVIRKTLEEQGFTNLFEN